MSIAEAAGFVREPGAQLRYPINLRFTIPFYPRSIFVTVIVGSEKRERARLVSERVRHPVNTWGNLIAMTIVVAVTSIAALFASLVALTY